MAGRFPWEAIPLTLDQALMLMQRRDGDEPKPGHRIIHTPAELAAVLAERERILRDDPWGVNGKV